MGKQTETKQAGPKQVEHPTAQVPTEEDMKFIRAIKEEEISWIPPPPEGGVSKLLAKMKENPFVPVGE